MLQAAGSWLSMSSKATGKLECWKVVFGYLEQLSDIYFTYSDKTTFFLQNTRTLEEINKKEALFQRLINHFGLLKKKERRITFFLLYRETKGVITIQEQYQKNNKDIYIHCSKERWLMNEKPQVSSTCHLWKTKTVN